MLLYHGEKGNTDKNRFNFNELPQLADLTSSPHLGLDVAAYRNLVIVSSRKTLLCASNLSFIT